MTVADAVAAAALAAPARLGPVRLVVVDGPAGSGKTTFAAALAEASGAHVLHLDDLYEGWSGLEGSLWPRLAAQVLEPLRRGLPGRYQRYDWGLGAFAEWVDLPVPRLLVIEGCGSARRLVDPIASVRVWVEAPDDLRLTRGLERDGADARALWEQWMRDEQAHYARESTRDRADVRLDALGRVVDRGAPVDPDALGVPGTAG